MDCQSQKTQQLQPRILAPQMGPLMAQNVVPNVSGKTHGQVHPGPQPA